MLFSFRDRQSISPYNRCPRESELSAASQEMLQNKLKQIITRNSAGAANDYNVFVIEPLIMVVDKQSTSGIDA